MDYPSSAQQDRRAVDWALLVVRLAVGIIFVAHGSQKMFGAFGGSGLAGVMGPMGPGGGGVVGLLVAIAEFFGGLGLLVGFLARFSAFWLIVEMVGAIVLVHGRNGFFLGQRPGYEYNLALIALLAAILIAGPGRFTLGRALPLPRDRETGRPHPLVE